MVGPLRLSLATTGKALNLKFSLTPVDKLAGGTILRMRPGHENTMTIVLQSATDCKDKAQVLSISPDQVEDNERMTPTMLCSAIIKHHGLPNI